MRQMDFENGPSHTIATGDYIPGSLPQSSGVFLEVTGKGAISIFYNPSAMSFIAYSRLTRSTSASLMEIEAMGKHSNPRQIVRESSLAFKTLEDLPPVMRFLLTCGPLPELNVAKSCLQEALDEVGGDLNKLRVPNIGFTALEWASKKGNLAAVKWLCSDERTKPMVSIGCPVGWACYVGRIQIARVLVEAGADPGSTDDVLFNRVPPLLLAAQNGRLEALKYLVEECGQNIRMTDHEGRDILRSIKDSTNWRDLPDHVECHKWAKKMLREGTKD